METSSRYRCIRAAQQCNSTPVPAGVCVQDVGIERGAGKVVLAVPLPGLLPDGSLQPLGVDFPDPLNGFKRSLSSGYPVNFGTATPQGRWSFRCGRRPPPSNWWSGVQNDRSTLTEALRNFSGRLPDRCAALAILQPSLCQKVTTICLIIINLYAVFKDGTLFYL